MPELATRIAVAPNGVDTEVFRPAPGAGPLPPRLITVGRISPEKGIHVLLEAFARLLPDHPRARLVLVGKEAMTPPALLADLSADARVRALRRFYPGPYLEPLLRRAGPRVREAVELVGEVGHAETAALYRCAGIVVSASLSESFGLAPVEGMACGLPAVVSRAGGLPETVEDGVNGLVVAADDPAALATAVARLLDGPELAARLGAAARQRAVERYDWTVAADAAAALYAGAA